MNTTHDEIPFDQIRTIFLGKSWAQIDEEAELAEEQELQTYLAAMDTLRKILWLHGDYIPEDGEIFE